MNTRDFNLFKLNSGPVYNFHSKLCLLRRELIMFATYCRKPITVDAKRQPSQSYSLMNLSDVQNGFIQSTETRTEPVAPLTKYDNYFVSPVI
jgi:hypothetical protein